MNEHILYGETLLDTYQYKNTAFEVIQRKPGIWVGTLGYVANLTDEPDIGAILSRYQNLTGIPKKNIVNEGWDACISIDYWQDGKTPRGIMFGEEVSDANQDSAYDLYEMPESVYIRVICSKKSAQNLLGKDGCDVWELFGFVKEVMALYGYVVNDNGSQEIEMYNHAAGIAYAYVPVKKA